MAKYALELEYDGSEFHGWQIQSGVATVQQSLERALSRFAHQSISTITAGRTDSGVHALNQVVHFESDAKRKLNGWVSGVNAYLPAAIRVKAVAAVGAEFDARFSACSRTYHYYVLIQPYASAHWHRYLGWYHYPLDLNAMQQAANLLIGTHDFSSFRAAGCQAATPIRQLQQLNIEQRGNIFRFSLTANAFLQHMVRNIVGALIYVGRHRLSIADFEDMFQARDRCQAPPTFMPNGLYLAAVGYPEAIFPSQPLPWLYQL